MAKRLKSTLKNTLDLTIYDNNERKIDATQHNTLETDIIDTMVSGIEPVITANLDMTTNKIINLADPGTDQEAATKKYVDDQIIAVGGAVQATLEEVETGEADVAKFVNPYTGLNGWLSWMANKVVPGLSTTATTIIGAINELFSGKADKTNILELDNTAVFTPDADYEPATKKYVDDEVGGITDATTASNGLTKVVDDIQLGGSDLDEDTTLSGTGSLTVQVTGAGGSGLLYVSPADGIGFSGAIGVDEFGFYFTDLEKGIFGGDDTHGGYMSLMTPGDIIFQPPLSGDLIFNGVKYDADNRSKWGTINNSNRYIPDVGWVVDYVAENADAGPAGASAYQIWLDEGNTGTEQDFLDSLVGPPGADGLGGADAVAGKLPSSYTELGAPIGTTSGTFVTTGVETTITLDEPVEIACFASFEIATLSGASSSTIEVAFEIDGVVHDAHGRYLSGSSDKGMGALVHRTGEFAAGTYTVKLMFRRASGVSTPGLNKADMLVMAMQGAKGEQGLSAYEVWLGEGNTGTEQDFLDSLSFSDFETLTDANTIIFTKAGGTMTTNTNRSITSISGVPGGGVALLRVVGTGTLDFSSLTGLRYQGVLTKKATTDYLVKIINAGTTITPIFYVMDTDGGGISTEAQAKFDLILSLYVPDAPTIATSISGSDISVDITAGADNGFAITGYRVEMQTDGGGYTTIEAGTTDDPYVIVAPGSGTHDIRVYAINAIGESVASNVDSETMVASFTIGQTSVLGTTAGLSDRRAGQYTVPQDGIINSISIYHTAAASGSISVGIFSNTSNTPDALLAIAAPVDLANATDWQTIDLDTPLAVTAGQIIWLSFIGSTNVNIRYGASTVRRAEGDTTYPLSTPWGAGTVGNSEMSIYANAIG